MINKQQLEIKGIIAYIILNIDDDNYNKVQDEVTILADKIDELIEKAEGVSSYETCFARPTRTTSTTVKP